MSTVEVPRSIPIFFPSQLLVGMSWIAPLGVDGDPLDLRADRCQLAGHVLVAALYVPGIAEQALAFGAKGGDHERRAGANVGDRHLGPAQPAWTVHDRMKPSLDVDARTHLRELRDV